MNTEHLHPKELRTLADVLAIVAEATLAKRLGSAMATRGAIVGRADAVDLADAVATWLADDGGDGGAQ